MFVLLKPACATICGIGDRERKTDSHTDRPTDRGGIEIRIDICKSDGQKKENNVEAKKMKWGKDRRNFLLSMKG